MEKRTRNCEIDTRRDMERSCNKQRSRKLIVPKLRATFFSSLITEGNPPFVSLSKISPKRLNRSNKIVYCFKTISLFDPVPSLLEICFSIHSVYAQLYTIEIEKFLETMSFGYNLSFGFNFGYV